MEKKNKHNQTTPGTIFDMNKINVGNFTYGVLNIISFGNVCSELYVGSFCSIAPNVTFLLSGEHNYNKISTFPINSKIFNEDETETNGNIIIEDDVWIGFGATILSGVKVGQGAVIGAGQVVAKDIPPYCIYAGNKIIKYRFSKDTIQELNKIDFGKIDKENLKEIRYVFNDTNIEENIKDIVKSLPKKDNKNF